MESREQHLDHRKAALANIADAYELGKSNGKHPAIPIKLATADAHATLSVAEQLERLNKRLEAVTRLTSVMAGIGHVRVKND